MSAKRIFGILLILVLLFGALPLTVLAEEAAEPEQPAIPEWKTWAQGDSRWGRVRLGNSWSTVAGEGCLVTAMSKLMIQSGLQDPETYTVKDFMKWMNANGGFTSTGAMLMAKPAQYSGLDYQGFLLGGASFSAKKWNDTLVSYAAQGYHMVLQVKNGGHWVAIDNELTLATGEVYIMDSLLGGVNAGITLDSRYKTFRSMVGYTGGTPYFGQPLPLEGTCGQGMYWKLEEETGLLTISGQGEMRDYDSGEIAPWLPFGGKITRVQVSEGVTKIGSHAFSAAAGYPNLTRITLADTVTQIGDHAFAGAASLTQITGSSQMTAIGGRAFSGADQLKQMTFPAGLTAIGAGAFADCTALETIRFEGEAPIFGKNCFAGVTARAWYPAGDLTWTAENKKNYGGSLTWSAATPAAPEVTISIHASTGAPSLTWDPVSHVASYQIWYTTGESGDYYLMDTVTEPFYIHTDPAPGTVCYYKVRALLNDGTMTSRSAPVCRIRDLAQPQGKSETLPSGLVKLSWNRIDGAQGYEVWRSASGKVGTFTYVSTVTGTSYTMTSQAAQADYCYKIRAIHPDPEAHSAFSGPIFLAKG